MAYTASTTLTSSGTGGKTNLSVEWSETGTSVSNNTSTISVTAKMTYNSAKWDVTNSGTLKAYFHDNRTGENIEVASISFNEFGYNTTSRTASGTCTRTHNDDGTLSGYGWAQWTRNNSYGNYAPGSGSCATDSKNLTTIARASEPSISPSTFNIGDTVAINTNRKSSSFTHKITLTFGSYSYVVGTSVGASVSLNTSNIASNLYAQIPNATSGSGTISCQTFNGSTSIGTKTCTFTAKAVEANVKPTFSDFAYADTNSTITAITGNNQYLVQGKSSLRVTISSANKATARSSATMSSYNASISGLSATANYSSSDLNINFSSNAFQTGNQTLSVKAIDSRGYGTTVSKTVPVLAYASPVINATATRQNNFENTTTLKVSGTYSPLTINNTAKNTVTTVEYRYKSQSTSTWGSWTAMTGLSVTSAGAYTTTDKVLNLDNAQAYDFEIRTTDRIGTSTTSLVVSVGIPIMRIGTDGYIYNQEQPLMPSHVGQVIMSTTLDTAAKVQAIYGGTWERWGAGKVPVGVDPNDTDFNAPNKSGGSKTVTLQLKHMPAHNHSEGGYGEAKARRAAKWYVDNSANIDGFRLSLHTDSGIPKYPISDLVVQGENQPHENMPPFLALYMWKRTA